jgi:hypothetical protein
MKWLLSLITRIRGKMLNKDEPFKIKIPFLVIKW